MMLEEKMEVGCTAFILIALFVEKYKRGGIQVCLLSEVLLFWIYQIQLTQSKFKLKTRRSAHFDFSVYLITF